MAEQTNPFAQEQLTPEEQEQILREEKARLEQQQASEFMVEQQRIAEEKFTPSAADFPRKEPAQPDIPGITREHRPLDPGHDQDGDPVDTLNISLESGVNRVDRMLKGEIDLNPSDATEILGDMTDPEKQ